MPTLDPVSQPALFEEITGECPACKAPTLLRRRSGNPWLCTLCGTLAGAWEDVGPEALEETLYCGRCTRHTVFRQSGSSRVCTGCGVRETLTATGFKEGRGGGVSPADPALVLAGACFALGVVVLGAGNVYGVLLLALALFLFILGLSLHVTQGWGLRRVLAATGLGCALLGGAGALRSATAAPADINAGGWGLFLLVLGGMWLVIGAILAAKALAARAAARKPRGGRYGH